MPPVAQTVARRAADVRDQALRRTVVLAHLDEQLAQGVMRPAQVPELAVAVDGEIGETDVGQSRHDARDQESHVLQAYSPVSRWSIHGRRPGKRRQTR